LILKPNTLFMLKPRPKAQGNPATTMRGPHKSGFGDYLFFDSTSP